MTSGEQALTQPNVLAIRKIFRAYDIRGNVSIFDSTLVRKIAVALAKMYLVQGQTQVVVGYDARLTSHEYSQIVKEVLCNAGLQVISVGCVSSPVLYFSALAFAGNGVMLTASHNPVSDNGIKWLIQGLPPTAEEIQHIADLTEQNISVETTKLGQVTFYDAYPAYSQFLTQDIKLKMPHRISLDGLHGSAGNMAQRALTKLGCDVDALHCEANGQFPLGAPDPSDKQRLALLRQSVLRHNAVMGIALDGDGDRVVVLDEFARIISPDRLMCLFAKICLLHHPQAEIVCDVKCSTILADTVRKYGGRFKMIRTGSSFLRHYLAEHQAYFGGEYAGHYVFYDGRGKGFDDGLYAALRILEYLEQTAQSLSQALAEFPERIATADIYIDSLDIDSTAMLHYLEQQFKNDNVIQLSKIDGIRLDFPYGFGIIRPSNTGEYFTVRFDADNAENLAYIRHTFSHRLRPSFPQIAQAIASIAS